MRRSYIESTLRANADEIEQIEAQREALYQRRLALWLEGRALDDPMTQHELAVCSRVTDGAVTQALRKIRLRANGVTR